MLITEGGIGEMIEESKQHEASCEEETREGEDVGEASLDQFLLPGIYS